MPAQITILIVTMDRRDILEKTLWHIYETSTDEERNIWVWDNASSDDTKDFLGTLQGWPGVRCFRSEVDLGIAEPRRRMLSAIETPCIFTLDDDMWMMNSGWAGAHARVLEADSQIHQITMGSMYHAYNNYGISHMKLDRPFFRVPPVLPGPKGRVDGREEVPGSRTILLGGESVIVPNDGPSLPFPCSGGASAWRVSDIRSVYAAEPSRDHHPIADLSEAWGMPLRARGMHEASIVGYGMLHPSPGPLWHLGRGERYWEERCRFAPAIYNRSGETQRSWLEAARKASGWGQSLEDPDITLKCEGKQKHGD